MIRRISIVAGLALWAGLAVQAYEWRNVGPESRIGGRMTSAGYMKGKVVLLDRRDYGDPRNADAIRQLQSIWASYKSKPFVLVGGHHGPSSRAKVEEAIKKLGVTFPVYEDVRYEKPDATPEDVEAMKAVWAMDRPLISILDSTCRKRLYYGHDERAAQGVVGSALMAAARPMEPKQWEFLLDWEVANLPGRAYLRLKEYREKYPEKAAKYAAFLAKAESDEGGSVRKLAKLVELSRQVKDRDPQSKRAKKLTPAHLEKAIEKYSELAQDADPNVVQEAKNSLADIKWAASDL